MLCHDVIGAADTLFGYMYIWLEIPKDDYQQ